MATLPLVIAGPLVRRITDTSASIWLALSMPAEVTLTVFSDSDSNNVLSSGSADPLVVADRIHVVMVTSKMDSLHSKYHEGRRYFYSINFKDPDGKEYGLFERGVLSLDEDEAENKKRLVYPNQKLPSFCIPPSVVSRLRVAHGSCRKPHGEGVDGFRYLDRRLQENLNDFHLLFLTGDQIYADDVHADLLDAIHIIVGKLSDYGDVELDKMKESYGELLGKGNRQKLVREHGGFTSTHASCHLATFFEFCIMYLMNWSDTLWTDVPDSPQLSEFRSALPAARRVLANTSSYMLFDDHEITDDWNLSQEWVNNTSQSKLGSSIITNGICAYLIFQHWGNVPERFEGSSVENQMLGLIESRNAIDGSEQPTLLLSLIHI